MKINFDFTIKNFDGTEVQLTEGTPVVASKLLSGWIMGAASSNPAEIMKYYSWASELWHTGSIDLDASGRMQFQNFVEQLPNVSVLIKVPILNALKNIV